MNAIRVSFVIITAVLAPLSTSLAGDGHGHKDGDINIGVTSGGQIIVEWSGEVVALPELPGPLFGFGLDEPGFFTLEEDEPGKGLFVLGAGANIVLEVLSFDDALQGWRPGFSGVFDDLGETWNIGGAPFDTHPFWHIDATDPLFVAPPGQTQWSATFRLLDTGSTGYAPSDPVTVTFTPEPGTLGLLMIGAMALIRRRTR